MATTEKVEAYKRLFSLSFKLGSPELLALKEALSDNKQYYDNLLRNINFILRQRGALTKSGQIKVTFIDEHVRTKFHDLAIKLLRAKVIDYPKILEESG